jgi:hypothetical protein
MRRLMFAAILTGVAASFASAQSPASLPPVPTLPSAPQTMPQTTAPPQMLPQPQGSQYPARMSIVAPNGVEVRSGPSLEYLPTSGLKHLDSVIVLRESQKQPGWLEIVPPAGSFSWIDGRHVMQFGREGIVSVEGGGEAGVLAGSSLVNKEPNVENAKVSSGTIVLLLQDRPMDANNRKWWPIKPPEREVRFIPKEAVLPPQASSVTPPNWSRPTANGSTDWRVPGQLIGSPANPGTGTPASFNQQPKDWSPYNGVSSQPPQWSQWGKLRRTAFEKDGQWMYVLEDRQGRPMLYVTTTPGTTLQGYAEKTVCLYGTISYRSDNYQRTYYMVASHVATP